MEKSHSSGSPSAILFPPGRGVERGHFGPTGHAITQGRQKGPRPVAAMLLAVVCLATPLAARAGSPPVVTNVTAGQRAGTTGSGSLVDIAYTISDSNFTSVNVYVLVSKDSGATWNVPANTFLPGSFIGTGIAVSASPVTNTITWAAGADWAGHFTTNCRVRVLANNLGIILIPAGSFTMGNVINDPDLATNLGSNDGSGPGGSTDCQPHHVTISNPYYMDSAPVTGGKWQLVIDAYASSNGYTFSSGSGLYKDITHPVQTIDWYDAVKWCNARSEMEGLKPAYYNQDGDGRPTGPYRSGEAAPFVQSDASGYRLPTEAEWEKAARGGASGHRFPWSDVDTISESQANYDSSPAFAFDVTGNSGSPGYNPIYGTGSQPYTSPVGSFAANGYGLYDMAGNVFEWCGNWYSTSEPGQTDPQGPATGTLRVLRGGSYGYGADSARCAARFKYDPAFGDPNFGFRCVRAAP